MSAPLQVSGGVGSVDVDLDALLAASRVYAGLGEVAGEAAREVGRYLWLELDDDGQRALLADPSAALRAVWWTLSRAGEDANHLADLLLRSVHIYRATDGMLLDPFDRAAIGLGRLTLGALETSTGHRAAGARQADAALTDLTDSLAWLVGTPLEVVYTGLVGAGHAVVHDLGSDERAGATTPPRGIADVMAQLALRNTGHDGEVSVSFIAGADGRTRAIVDIPGTKSWNPWPTHDVTGVGTDALAINGLPTSYEQGVLDALERAGVPADMPIMLVGHSLGGIVAVNAARDAVASGRFRVTHVVTAGAPIGRVAARLPRTVSVLALENSADVVPETDGFGNPVSSNVTTVTIDSPQGSIGADHDLGRVYQPEAAAVDASADPSIRAFLSGASGFLGGTGETTRAYWIQRD